MIRKKYFIVTAILVLLVSCSTAKRVSTVEPERLSETDRKKFDLYFYEGLNQKENGAYDQAFETFGMCYAIDSLDAGLLAEMSSLHSVAGLNENALRYMEKACEADTYNWWYHSRLISLYAEAKQTDKAIQTALQLQKKFPQKEEAYQMLGMLYKQNKQPEKAIEVYNLLEKITGIEESLSFEKFYLYAQQNKIAKAIAEIDKLVARYPTNTRYKVIRGDIFMQQKMPEKAFETYVKVLEADPENPYIYISLTEYYETMNQPAKAIESVVNALKNPQLVIDEKIEVLGRYVQKIIQDSTRFEETESLFKLLVEHYPLEEQVHGYYSVYLQHCKRIPEALNELESMININPKNEQTWLNIIQIYLADQKYNEVLSVSDRAIQVLPNVVQFYFYKAITQFQLGEYESALITNQTAIALVPENMTALKSDFYAQIGDIQYKLGKNNEAFAAYEESLKANSGNIYVMNNYAYYLSELNIELKKAEKLSAKTVEKEPTNSTYLDTYAWIFYQQGNFTLAKFYIERAIDNLKKDQDPGVIYEHYGDILWKKGDKTKALEMWQKALDSGYSSDQLKLKIENKELK